MSGTYDSISYTYNYLSTIKSSIFNWPWKLSSRLTLFLATIATCNLYVVEKLQTKIGYGVQKGDIIKLCIFFWFFDISVDSCKNVWKITSGNEIPTYRKFQHHALLLSTTLAYPPEPLFPYHVWQFPFSKVTSFKRNFSPIIVYQKKVKHSFLPLTAPPPPSHTTHSGRGGVVPWGGGGGQVSQQRRQLPRTPHKQPLHGPRQRVSRPRPTSFARRKVLPPATLPLRWNLQSPRPFLWATQKRKRLGSRVHTAKHVDCNLRHNVQQHKHVREVDYIVHTAH